MNFSYSPLNTHLVETMKFGNVMKVVSLFLSKMYTEHGDALPNRSLMAESWDAVQLHATDWNIPECETQSCRWTCWQKVALEFGIVMWYWLPFKRLKYQISRSTENHTRIDNLKEGWNYAARFFEYIIPNLAFFIGFLFSNWNLLLLELLTKRREILVCAWISNNVRKDTFCFKSVRRVKENYTTRGY